MDPWGDFSRIKILFSTTFMLVNSYEKPNSGLEPLLCLILLIETSLP